MLLLGHQAPSLLPVCCSVILSLLSKLLLYPQFTHPHFTQEESGKEKPPPNTHTPLNIPIPLLSSWPEPSQWSHLCWGRLHFPKVAKKNVSCPMCSSTLWTCHSLDKSWSIGVPLWHSRVRIQCCHWRGSGLCCGGGPIPGQGTSTCHTQGQKKVKKKVETLIPLLLNLGGLLTALIEVMPAWQKQTCEAPSEVFWA